MPYGFQFPQMGVQKQGVNPALLQKLLMGQQQEQPSQEGVPDIFKSLGVTREAGVAPAADELTPMQKAQIQFMKTGLGNPNPPPEPPQDFWGAPTPPPTRDTLEGNPFLPFGRFKGQQPKEPLGRQIATGTWDAIKSINLGETRDFSKATDTADPSALMAAAKPGQMQAAPPQEKSLFGRLDAERGYSVPKEDGYGKPGGQDPMGSIFSGANEAAAEAVQKGVKTPDQADEYIHMEFKGDPYLDEAIASARQEYQRRQAETGAPPGILDYLGYTLMALAGINPAQAAEMVTRRHEKLGYENQAYQNLNRLEGTKIAHNQRNSEMASREGVQMQKLQQMMGMQEQKGQQRTQERAETQNAQGLRSGRSAAIQRLGQLMQAKTQAGPGQGKALDPEIEQLKKRIRFFNQQMGEPDDKDIQSRVDRLLGLDVSANT